jgi:hypothetical protein
MDIVLQILQIILPLIAVVAVVYIILNKNTDKELRVIALNNKKPQADNTASELLKLTLPTKLQAYERIVMLLERIAPSSLIMRVHKAGMSAKLLHADLLKAIREDFEHNVSQQIYISDNAWNLTKQAKEETIKIINLATSKMDDNATGIDLSKAIFEMMMQLQQSPSGIALDYLHKEVDKAIN